MQKRNLREAFSMIMAIFIIVIMASIGALVMNLGGKIVKATTTQYQHEQASLYAKSYTEYAVLAVTGNDRTGNCLQTINGTIGDINLGGYSVRTDISYIGNDAIVGTCAGGVRQLNAAALNTTATPLTIIIDAYVDYKDPDNAAQTLTVHRRSVEKI